MLRSNTTNSSIFRSNVTETLENDLSSDILGSLNVARYSALVGSQQGILLIPLGGSTEQIPVSQLRSSSTSVSSVQPNPKYQTSQSYQVSNSCQASNLVAKSVPVLKIPPVPQRFLGRQAEIATAIEAIAAGRCLEIVGPPGIGKSTFLRYLAHRPEVTTSHPDGILYLPRVQPVADWVQTIGEHFYLIYPDSKLLPQEWQVSLQELQILIILADPQWLAEDIQTLQRLLPQSTFLLAAQIPRSLPNCQSLPLKPLALAEGYQLAEQVMDRSLTAVEQTLVERCWQRFQGQPARLVQVLEMVHQGQLSWQHCERTLLAVEISNKQASQRLIHQVFSVLSTPQRWILGLLSALDGVGLTAQQIASMTGPQEPQSSLQGLVRLALVQHLEGRYSLPHYVRSGVAAQFDSQPWMERGASVLSAWLGQQPPEAILPEVPVVMVFLRWAVQQKRWALVLELARSLDSTLVIGKQWEEWRRVLQWALQAAWQLQDRESEAWAWHQLGVRALCLEDLTTAYDALHQALRLRQELGDAQAIALTTRMLSYSMQGTLPAKIQSEIRGEEPRWQTNMLLIMISLVTFLVALLLGLGVRQWLQPSESPLESLPSSPQSTQ